MPPRWKWDFEDESRRRRAPEAPYREPLGSPQADPDRPEIRRRRLLALIVTLAVVAGLVALLGGSHHRQPSTTTASAAAGTQRARAHPAGDPQNDERAAVAAVLAYTPFIKAGSTRVPDVALTFDDGPGPYTPQVLSVLERFHVRATFFAIGRMERYFSASTVREIEDGDVIGDHTENHPALARLSAHDQREELAEQIARIELLGGRRPVLFRPPYGSFNATTIRELHAMHLLMVLWSVDAQDYLRPGVPTIVSRALEGAHPGAIILLHDAGGNRRETIEALPKIIRGIRARGLRLVTVPRLLMDDPPPPGQPLPPSLAGD